jgi:hypothetical protein
MRRELPVLFSALLLCSCGSSAPEQQFSGMLQEFVSTTLSFSPVAAVAAGYHAHNDIPLDEQIDSFSPESVKRQLDFYEGFEKRLDAKVEAGGLNAQELADAELMRDQCRLARFELGVQQRYKHDPTLYVELAGNAIFTPLVLEYAPLDKRYQHIAMRLQQVRPSWPCRWLFRRTTATTI